MAKITLPSAINHVMWETLLQNYKDKQVLAFLRYGWPIGYDSTKTPTPTYRNHPSATNYSSQIRSFINKECSEQAMLGPFYEEPFDEWFQVSPLMSRPKKDVTERRVIIDLSYPEGEGVNSAIVKNVLEGEELIYSLPTLSSLTQALIDSNQEMYFWKADLRRAYRQMRCCPLSYPLLGIKFEGEFFVDICPSFGCRLSGGAQMRVSAAIAHMFSQWTGSPMLYYVDDFISWSTSPQKAWSDFHAFHELCQLLGMELAGEKSITPTKTIDWLGFMVDSVTMTVYIPPNKLNEVIRECQQWHDRHEATRKQIQSLAGKLNHISQAVSHGRRFMARILESLSHAPNIGRIPISPGFKADTRWFMAFAAQANCKRLLAPNLPTVVLVLTPTALGGYSSTLNTHLETQAHDHQYTPKQLVAINVIMCIKAIIPAGSPPSLIEVINDNTSVTHALNSGKSKDRTIAACSREIFLFAATKQHVVHLTTTHNIPAQDHSSRACQPIPLNCVLNDI